MDIQLKVYFSLNKCMYFQHIPVYVTDEFIVIHYQYQNTSFHQNILPITLLTGPLLTDYGKPSIYTGRYVLWCDISRVNATYFIAF